MESIALGFLLTLAAALLAWLGVRHRKKARKDYEVNSRIYTAATTMTVIKLDESEFEWWDDREDGSRELRRDTVFTPTYSYTVDGKTYQYRSDRSDSTSSLGRQVTGYYDPSDPSRITEVKPKKPILGGGGYFACAIFLLFFAVMCFIDNFCFF